MGVPPKDLIPAIAAALRAASYDYDEAFQRCTAISNEWTYNAVNQNLEDRFSQGYIRERTVPMTHKTLEETLCPQPDAHRVLLKLLAWIDEVDSASQTRNPRPPFQDSEGGSIFPPEGADDEKWWLTEMSKRKEEERMATRGDEDGPLSEDDEESDEMEKERVANNTQKNADDNETDDDEMTSEDARELDKLRSVNHTPELPTNDGDSRFDTPHAWSISRSGGSLS